MAITDYYVTVTGGATKTGTVGDPFSWAELKTRMSLGGTAAPGDRYNIQEGTYTLIATDTWTIDGSADSPIVIRGCKTDWSVISPTCSNYNGELITTNFPYLSYNANGLDASASDYLILTALKINSSRTNATLAARYNCLVYGCTITNTASNASAGCMVVAGGSVIRMCDVACSGATSGSAISSLAVSAGVRFHGNIVSDSAIYGIRLGGIDNVVQFNIVYGCADYGIYVGTSNTGKGTGETITHNTIYCTAGKGIGFNAAIAYTGLMEVSDNHITDGTAYAFEYTNVAGCPMFFARNRTRDNIMGAINVTGDWATATTWNHITTDTGGPETDYVNAPTDLNLIPKAPAIAQGIMSSDIGGAQKKEAIKRIGFSGGMGG